MKWDTYSSDRKGGAAILEKPDLHDLIGFFDSPIY
jgi:hypothetical protein